MLNFMRNMKDSIIAKIMLSLIIIGFLGLGFSGYNNLEPEPKLIQIDDYVIYKSDLNRIQQSIAICNVASSEFQFIFQDKQDRDINLQKIIVMGILESMLDQKQIVITENDQNVYRNQSLMSIVNTNAELLNINKRNIFTSLDRCQIFDTIFQNIIASQYIMKNRKYHEILYEYYDKQYDIDYVILDNKKPWQKYLAEQMDKKSIRNFYNQYKKQIEQLKLYTIKFLEITPDQALSTENTIVDGNTQTDENNLNDDRQDVFLQKIEDIQIMLDQNITLEKISNTINKPIKEDLLLYDSVALVDMQIINTKQHSSTTATSTNNASVIKLPQQKIPASVLNKLLKQQRSTQANKNYVQENTVMLSDSQTMKYWLIQYKPQAYKISDADDVAVTKLYQLKQLNQQLQEHAQDLLNNLQTNLMTWKQISETSYHDNINRAEITKNNIIKQNQGYQNNITDNNKFLLSNYLNTEQLMQLLYNIDLNFSNILNDSEQQNKNQKQDGKQEEGTLAINDNKIQDKQSNSDNEEDKNTAENFILFDTIYNNSLHKIILRLNNIDRKNRNDVSSSVIYFGFVYSAGHEFIDGLLKTYLPKITLYPENILRIYKNSKEDLDQLTKMINNSRKHD